MIASPNVSIELAKSVDMTKKSLLLARPVPPLDFSIFYDWRILLILFALVPLSTNCQEQALPWLKHIDPNETVGQIHTIATHAEVTVSDGLTYKTRTVFHDKQRAVFQRIYSDRRVVEGIEGKYIWRFDGLNEKEAPEFIENIILGHQFHAQILFFDKLHNSIDSVQRSKFNGKECLVLTSQNESPDYKFYFEKDGYPSGFEIFRIEESNIVFEFNDWRSVSGITLPFRVHIDDGERKFEYRFRDVKLNEGSIADFRAPDSIITEEQKLMRLHRIIMDGHLFGQTEEMKMNQSDSMIIVSAGEIYHVAGNQPDAMIDRIMSNRDYTRYDDLVRPIISISEDGTMGWVIAQIAAEGIRFDETGNPTGPLEFVCSWIELYEKEDGIWKMKGNVSTFQPGLK